MIDSFYNIKYNYNCNNYSLFNITSNRFSSDQLSWCVPFTSKLTLRDGKKGINLFDNHFLIQLVIYILNLLLFTKNTAFTKNNFPFSQNERKSTLSTK